MPTPPAQRPLLLRAAAVLLAAAALLLAGASPAAAHTDRGLAGSDFDGQVLGLSAPMPGVVLQVTGFGDSLELSNTSTTTVTVYGYSDEEYLRIGPDGVWRNANSPATHINLRRDGLTTLPAHADPDAAPDWQQVSTQPEYSWHDHRTHWMSPGLPPQVAADPTIEHTIIEWQVPLAYGDQSITANGELTWSPPPNGGLWWPVYLLLAAAGALAGFLARTPRPLAAVLAATTAAAVWHLVATPQPGLTAMDRGLALAAASLPTVVVLGITVLGARAGLRGNGLLTGLLAAVVGFMHLVQGLPDVDILWSANLITGGPPALARLSVGLLIFGGLGLMAGSVGANRRFRPVSASPVPPHKQPGTSSDIATATVGGRSGTA